MLVNNSQVERNCIISKNSCEQICIQDPDVVQSVGSRAIVVVAWLSGSVGATGIFLGKTITYGTQNTGTEFNSTEGFIQMIKTCFPDLVDATFGLTISGAVVVTFPDVGSVDNFNFSEGVATNTDIGIAATNGTNPVVQDCHFLVKMYDFETGELICTLDEQLPVINDDYTVSDTCFSVWNAFQSTTIPDPDQAIDIIDPNFCKVIFYRIWKRCNDGNGCYASEQLIETTDYTLTNSCIKDMTPFCTYTGVNAGDPACPMTELDCIKVCGDAWLWFCPNFKILDDNNFPYTYISVYEFFDASGSLIVEIRPILGITNSAYILPTGLNFLNNNASVPADYAYYTVKTEINFFGNITQTTKPIRYEVIEDCFDEVIYFREEAGGISSICVLCDDVVIESKVTEVCNTDGCKEEAGEAGRKTNEYRQYQVDCLDEKLLEVFGNAKEHWISKDGEFVNISIKSKKVTVKDKNKIPTLKFKVTIK